MVEELGWAAGRQREYFQDADAHSRLPVPRHPSGSILMTPWTVMVPADRLQRGVRSHWARRARRTRPSPLCL
jgi:hypothetical protein